MSLVIDDKTMMHCPSRLGIVRLLAYGKILDVGCGLGTTFGGDATNLDILDNNELIEEVKKTNLDAYTWFTLLFPDGKTPNYVRADASKRIPFDDKTFDCSVLSEILEHHTMSVGVDILKEAGRVSNFVIVTVPNEWEWPEEFAFNKNVSVERDKHKTFYTKDMLMDCFRKAGLYCCYYMQLSVEMMSHHIVVGTTERLMPVCHRFGVGYILGVKYGDMIMSTDEIVSYVPVR